MAQRIPLEAIPNQEIDFQADDTRYVLRFHTNGDLLSVDISVNEEFVIEGVRVMSGTTLMPYEYEESTGGNFLMYDETEQVIFYENLGVNQFLIYLTADDMAALRDG